MKEVISLLIFLSTALNLKASHLFFSIGKNSNVSSDLIEFAHEIRDSFNSDVFIFEENDRFLISINGYSHVFEFKENQNPKNLYKGKYHKYNVNAFKWMYKGHLYSYGGTLLWNYFPDVIFFKEEVGGWEIHNYLGRKPIPIDSLPATPFYFQDKLFVLFPQKNLYIKDESLFEFSFEGSKWKLKGKIKRDLVPTNYTSAHLKSYVVFFEDSGLVSILSKEDLKIATVDTFYLPPQSSFFLNEDQLEIRDIFSNKVLYAMEADQYFTQYSTSTKGIKKIVIHWKYLAVLLVIPLFFVLKPRLVDPGEFPFPKLLTFKGQIIDQEKLDECLGVNYHSSISSKRNKRSKTLIHIYKNYSSVIKIERIRDEVDSRMFKYRIW